MTVPRGVVRLVLVVAAIAAIVTGCNPDITEQFFSVRIKNDLATSIGVQQCSDPKCTEVSDTFQLDRGESFSATTSSEGVANPYRFVRANGSVVGGFPLFFRHRVDGLVLLISHSGIC